MIVELVGTVIVVVCAAVSVWCAVDSRRHRKRAEAALASIRARDTHFSG